MHSTDDRLQPKRNSVSRYTLFPLPNRKKEVAADRMILLSPGQIVLNCSDRPQQYLLSMSIHEV